MPDWIAWLQYLSFMKYGFAALAQNQFEVSGSESGLVLSCVCR